MYQYLYLAAGLILLLNGSDWLLEGAAALAKRFNIHKLVIGLTIVAFGTSLPELFVTIIGSGAANSDIVVGNLFGSNVANILLILGIAALIYPITMQHSTIWKEIPFSFLAYVIVLLLSYKAILGMQNLLTPLDGIILLLLFVLFLYYTVDLVRKKREETADTKQEIDLASPKTDNMYIIIASLLAGVIALWAGGTMTVDNAVLVAKSLGISSYFISATIIAVGTSLPELFVTVRAAFKKESDLAIGNIVGSNIFNTLFILGIATLIRPIPAPDTFAVDIILMMAATLMLFICVFIGAKNMLKRWQGTVFLLAYAAYVLYLISR